VPIPARRRRPSVSIRVRSATERPAFHGSRAASRGFSAKATAVHAERPRKDWADRASKTVRRVCWMDVYADCAEESMKVTLGADKSQTRHTKTFYEGGRNRSGARCRMCSGSTSGLTRTEARQLAELSAEMRRWSCLTSQCMFRGRPYAATASLQNAKSAIWSTRPTAPAGPGVELAVRHSEKRHRPQRN